MVGRKFIEFVVHGQTRQNRFPFSMPYPENDSEKICQHREILKTLILNNIILEDKAHHIL